MVGMRGGGGGGGGGGILPMEMVLEAHPNSIAYEASPPPPPMYVYSLTGPPWRGLMGSPNSTKQSDGRDEGRRYPVPIETVTPPLLWRWYARLGMREC